MRNHQIVNSQGRAVTLLAGCEGVVELQARGADGQIIWKDISLRLLLCDPFQQIRFLHEEKILDTLRVFLLEQVVEVVDRGNVAQAFRVKRLGCGCKSEFPVAAHLRICADEPLLELVIVSEKRKMRMQAFLDQPLPDEKLRCLRRIDAPVGDTPPRNDGEPVQRHLLIHLHDSGFLVKTRKGVTFATKAPAKGFQPAHINVGDFAGVEPRGFNLFSRQHPRSRLAMQSGPRKHEHLFAAARAILRFLVLLCNLVEQSGKQGTVNRPIICGIVVDDQQLCIAQDACKLTVDIAPLAHPHKRKKVRFAKLA